MSENVAKDNHNSSLSSTVGEKIKLTWNQLVEAQVEAENLKGVTCHIFSTGPEGNAPETKHWACGRLDRERNFVGKAKTIYENAKSFNGNDLTHEAPVTVYGELKNGARYLRYNQDVRDLSKTLCELIVDDVGTPELLMSCYGGAGYFTMSDNLEKEFMNGIGQVATTKGVWILTTGLSRGVSNVVGQSLHRYTWLNRKVSNPTVIGLNSWGAVTERTRKVLQYRSSEDPVYTVLSAIGGKRPTIMLSKTEEKTLDKCHTHFLLLDDGSLNRHLSDDPRFSFVTAVCEKTKCYTVTVIVEGGSNILGVVLNDLKLERPVIIIDGSGRIANILGALLKTTGKNKIPKPDKMKHYINENKYPALATVEEYDEERIIRNITAIFDPTRRRYLKVFDLDSGASLTDTIFQAVIETHVGDKAKLEKLLELAVTWNCIHGAHYILKRIEVKEKHYDSLFKKALTENRPEFVEYFLRRYYNPLQTTGFLEFSKTHENSKSTSTATKSAESATDTTDKSIVLSMKNVFIQQDPLTEQKTMDEIYVAFALELIVGLYTPMPSTSEQLFHKCEAPVTLDKLDEHYAKLIGWHYESFYFERGTRERLMRFFGCDPKYTRKVSPLNITPAVNEHKIADLLSKYAIKKTFGKQDMLRDLLLWSVYANYANIAFVLLLQLESRIGAALLATNMARNLSLLTDDLESRHRYEEQAKAYEKYASDCIKVCHNINQRRACELLLRELPLFGNVTCMQYGKDQNMSQDKPDKRARWKGIYDKPIQQTSWIKKIELFHRSPIVKMSYHFLVYIWFLLVFSYLMLFSMGSEDDPIHWTEIYVVVTVTAMLIEDLRKVIVDYHTQMLERWHPRNIWMIILNAIPYILFYIGFFLHVGSRNRPDLFTAARVVLAIDLELWYLASLRFISAIKLLGPKLVMIRNMTRYLFAFIYLIFICIAAYGVVSRALFMRDQVEFTAKSLFVSIFYRPYWFLYSIVDDEKKDLDNIISSNTSTSDQVITATVTHVLLTFHMIFINILLLNLLIAVFNLSFEQDQGKNEYYWRYHRYELIKEYFGKPRFAYPPLSLLVYVFLLLRVYVRKGVTCRIFKRLVTPDWDDYWTDFENAATYAYARTLVEKKYRHHTDKKKSKRSADHEETPPDNPVEAVQATPEDGTQAERIITHVDVPTRAIFDVDLQPTSN